MVAQRGTEGAERERCASAQGHSLGRAPAVSLANRSGQSVRRCCTSGIAGAVAGSTDRATTAKPVGMAARVDSDLAATRHCVRTSSFIAREDFEVRPISKPQTATGERIGRGRVGCGCGSAMLDARARPQRANSWGGTHVANSGGKGGDLVVRAPHAAALTRQGAMGNLAIQSRKILTTYLFLRLRSGRIWWAQMYRLVVPLSSRTWTCTECSCTHSVGRGHTFHVHNRVRYSCTRTAYARHAHRVVHYMHRIHAVCAEYCMRVHSVRIVKEHLIPGRRVVPHDRPRDVFPVWIAPTNRKRKSSIRGALRQAARFLPTPPEAPGGGQVHPASARKPSKPMGPHTGIT